MRLPVFASIAAGMYHTLILSEGGKVHSWGLNDYGQLGVSPTDVTHTGMMPTPVDALTQNVIVRVVCGMFHSAAIAHNGQLYTWGNNAFGQLGRGYVGCKLGCRLMWGSAGIQGCKGQGRLQLRIPGGPGRSCRSTPQSKMSRVAYITVSP